MPICVHTGGGLSLAVLKRLRNAHVTEVYIGAHRRLVQTVTRESRKTQRHRLTPSFVFCYRRYPLCSVQRQEVEWLPEYYFLAAITLSVWMLVFIPFRVSREFLTSSCSGACRIPNLTVGLS